MERRWERFAEECDIGLDQPATRTPWYGAAVDVGMHVRVRVGGFTVNAALGGERAVGFYKFIDGNAGNAFEGIDVLRETFQQQPLVRDQADERMGDSRLEFTGVELAGKSVERNRVRSEE